MKRLLFFGFLLLTGFVQAQRALRPPVELPRATVKFNLFPLLSATKQGLIAAGDFRVSPRMAVDAGLGWYFNSSFLAGREGEYYQGLGLRAGAKYYFPKREKGIFFLGLDSTFNYIRHLSYREAFRQGQQYVQILPVHRKVLNYGISLRAGGPTFFGRKKQFIVEPVVGLGVQFFEVSRKLPPDAELLIPERALITFEVEPGSTRLVDVYFGLWFGVVLW